MKSFLRSFSSHSPTHSRRVVVIYKQKYEDEVPYWFKRRALDHPILGPKFGPIPNAKKYVFFSIPDKKFPI